jgi:hypothetical protein
VIGFWQKTVSRYGMLLQRRTSFVLIGNAKVACCYSCCQPRHVCALHKRLTEPTHPCGIPCVFSVPSLHQEGHVSAEREGVYEAM